MIYAIIGFLVLDAGFWMLWMRGVCGKPTPKVQKMENP